MDKEQEQGLLFCAQMVIRAKINDMAVVQVYPNRAITLDPEQARAIKVEFGQRESYFRFPEK